MEVNEKELKERKEQIQKQIQMLQRQHQQAMQAAQQIPLNIAVLQGELNGINKLLEPENNVINKDGKKV